jgi:hypothetical protein
MTRIAIELEMPAHLAEAAEKQGLLSSSALLELIKRELDKNPPPEAKEFDPADYPPGYKSWMVGKVSPEMFGKGKILVSDEEFMEPIEADWYAARGSWGPGLEDDDDCH